jgi:prepilin-type N-terminal cleavage/methylation domain-containing protein
MKTNHKNNSGFTLIELLVSLAIFSIVVVASLGAVISISDANRRVQKTRAVLDNLNLSIESMSRNLRLGTSYHCEKINPVTYAVPSTNLNTTLECGGGWGDFIAFEDQYGDSSDPNDQGIYYLDINPASPTYQSIMYRRYGTSSAVALTSDDLSIRSLRFYVTGTATGQQPKVIIGVSGVTEVGKSQEPVEINIQTTVSQRNLNI